MYTYFALYFSTEPKLNRTNTTANSLVNKNYVQGTQIYKITRYIHSIFNRKPRQVAVSRTYRALQLPERTDWCRQRKNAGSASCAVGECSGRRGGKGGGEGRHVGSFGAANPTAPPPTRHRLRMRACARPRPAREVWTAGSGFKDQGPWVIQPSRAVRQGAQDKGRTKGRGRKSRQTATVTPCWVGRASTRGFSRGFTLPHSYDTWQAARCHLDR